MTRRTKAVSSLIGRVTVVMVLGAGIGIALGSILGNVVFGTALGALIGLLAGAILEVTRRRNRRR